MRPESPKMLEPESASGRKPNPFDLYMGKLRPRDSGTLAQDVTVLALGSNCDP